MKNRIKNIVLWIVPAFTTICSIVYINMAVKNNENMITNTFAVSDNIEVNPIEYGDKKSVTHFE